MRKIFNKYKIDKRYLFYMEHLALMNYLDPFPRHSAVLNIELKGLYQHKSKRPSIKRASDMPNSQGYPLNL